MREHPLLALSARLTCQRIRGDADGLQRTAQVMTQHGNELVAQVSDTMRIGERGFRSHKAIFLVEVASYQVGQQLHGALDVGYVEVGRCRINRAERSEEAPVWPMDGNGRIALKPVDPWRVMLGVNRVLACMRKYD
ncbi:hypothetical protein D3C75_978270 [compost metagenome]